MQKELVQLYLESSDDTNNDWCMRKLISYCLYKGLTSFIPIVLYGNKPYTPSNEKIDLNISTLKTVIHD